MAKTSIWVTALGDYERLGSLPYDNDSEAAALFIPDGMVTGTERAERWLLWPMEIQNPGAMQ